MAYIKVKTRDGEVTLSPKEIRAAGKQIAAQLKDMTFTEMVETAAALKDMIHETGIWKLMGILPR